MTISRPPLRERLGLPPLAGHGRFVTAIAIDALGSGVFMPLSVLYFLATTDLAVETVGLAMSLQAALTAPFVLVVGHLVDRFGAKRLLLAGNLILAAGYAAFPLARDLAGVIALLTVVGLGHSAFYGSYSPTVAAIAREGEREMWFGFLGSLRNLGMAVGGLVAGAALAVGTPAAFHTAVLADAASYVVSFVLLLRVHAHVVPRARDDRPTGGWGAVLRDRAYLLLVACGLVYALCGMALNIAMPVYAVALGLPGWSVGGFYVVNTLLVGLAQTPLVRTLTGHRRHRIMAAAFGLSGAGFAGLAALVLVPPAVAVAGFFLAVAVYTLGEIYGGPVLSAAAVEAAPDDLRGRYLSMLQLTWPVAGILAPAAYTRLLAWQDVAVWAALGTAAAVGVALTAPLARNLPAAAARVTNAAA